MKKTTNDKKLNEEFKQEVYKYINLIESNLETMQNRINVLEENQKFNYED